MTNTNINSLKIMPLNITTPRFIVNLCGLCLAIATLLPAPAWSKQEYPAADVLPLSARQLIGTKLASVQRWKEHTSEYDTITADIPGFLNVGGGGSLSEDLYVYSGLFGKQPAFVLYREYPDHTLEILNIQPLPKSAMQMQLKNGKVVYRKKGYLFADDCSHTGNEMNDKYPLFGLINPEKGKENCSHVSKRLVKVWQVDQESGTIKVVPAKNISCSITTMDDCY
jgi:hypothetical protein